MLRINRLSKQMNRRWSVTERNPKGERHIQSRKKETVFVLIFWSYTVYTVFSEGHNSIMVGVRGASSNTYRSEEVC